VASIADDPNGRRRILFVAPDGSRKTIRLGKCDRKTAEAVCRHVEGLLSAKISGQPIPRDTAAWLASVGAVFRGKLAAVGLVERERRIAVRQFLTDWLATKKAAGHKTASLIAWGQTAAELTRLFGDREVSDLSHADAEGYRGQMLGRDLRQATVHRRLGHARQMFEDAVRLGHTAENPWRHVRVRAGDPSERRAYVPVPDARRVIDHCPNVWWRLLVALGRFGGFRVPSEAFSLTWGDVDWERSRLSVPSPKTEGTGKTHRVIPLFPLLRPFLDAAFSAAAEGAVYVIPDEYRLRAAGAGGWANANLRTTLQKVIRRAGVNPWPRLWHSLRASCESDLAQSFPLAVVTKWMGNTPSVALRHYIDPTDAAFDQAARWVPAGGAQSGAHGAQNPAQQPAAANRSEPHLSAVNADGGAGYAPPCGTVRDDANVVCGGAGNRTSPENTAKTPHSETGGAESGAPSIAILSIAPELAAILDAWPHLSEPIKAGILAMVRAAGG
jgi:integrase